MGQKTNRNVVLHRKNLANIFDFLRNSRHKTHRCWWRRVLEFSVHECGATFNPYHKYGADFNLHSYILTHPRTTETSGMFTTTGRILFYNSWTQNFGKLKTNCSEFHEWLMHLTSINKRSTGNNFVFPWIEYCRSYMFWRISNMTVDTWFVYSCGNQGGNYFKNSTTIKREPLRAFFRLWWSWIMVIIQKEKGRRKMRKEGGGIERDARVTNWVRHAQFPLM